MTARLPQAAFCFFFEPSFLLLCFFCLLHFPLPPPSPFASHSLSRSPQLRLAAEAAAARRRRSRQLSVFRSRNVNCASLPPVAARRRCPLPLPLPGVALPYSFALVHCDLWSLLNGVDSDAFYAAAALRCFVTVVIPLLLLPLLLLVC